MSNALLLPVQRIPAPKPPSRIVLDMAFGVGAGAVLGDKSRYRSHGAITTATWAAGVHGFCLDFVSANPDHVVIPAAHTQLDFTTQDFSIVFRVIFDSLATSPLLISRGLFNTDGWYLQIAATGQYNFHTNQSPGNQTTRTAAGAVVIANWYTMGVSRTGNSVRLLLDGVDVTNVVGVHVDPLTCGRFCVVGVDQALAAFPLDGRVEFLRVFRGIALSTSEHLAWHNALL